MAYYNGKKVVFSPHYHSGIESETLSVKISIDPESRGEFTLVEVFGTIVNSDGTLADYSNRTFGELEIDLVKKSNLLVKYTNDLIIDYSDLPSIAGSASDGNQLYSVDDSIQPEGTNLLEMINGTYNLTGRTLTVTNGDAVCNVSSGSSSAVLIQNSAFESDYIPAGDYYFDMGIVSQQGLTISNPFIRFTDDNDVNYDFAEGLFTLPVAAKINTIRNGETIIFSEGMRYTIRPQIKKAEWEIHFIAG